MSSYSTKPRLGQGQVRDYKALAGKVSRRDNSKAPQNGDSGKKQENVNPEHTGGIFKTAAIKVLKQERRLMSAAEITRLAVERKLVSKTSKSPENTMTSIIYADVRKKGDNSSFFKPREGLFGLRSWIGEPWIENWLRHEGISMDDTSERTYSHTPPVKRHKSNKHAHDSSRAKSGETGNSSDSDDKTSNLNLLLEAADEINRTEAWPVQAPNCKRSNSGEQHEDAGYPATIPHNGMRIPAAGQSDPPDQLATSMPQMQAGRPPRPTLNRRRSVRSSEPGMDYSMQSPMQSPNNLVLQIPNAMLQNSGTTALQYSPMNYALFANTLGSPIGSPMPLTAQGLFSPHSSAPGFDPSVLSGMTPTIMPITPLGNLDASQLQGITLSGSALSPNTVQHPPPTMFGDRGLELRGYSLATAAQNAAQAAAQSAGDGEDGSKSTPPQIFELDLPDFDVTHGEDPMDSSDEPGSMQVARTKADVVKGEGPHNVAVSVEGAAAAAKEAGSGEQQVHGAAPTGAPTECAQVRNMHQGEVTMAGTVPPGKTGCQVSPTGVTTPSSLASQPGVTSTAPAEAADTAMALPGSAAVAGVGESPDATAATAAAAPSTVAAGQGAEASTPEFRTYPTGIDHRSIVSTEIVHPAQINLTRQHIHLLEKTLGHNHPTVGKAYIYLARLLMNEGSRWSVTMAKRSLYRSWSILSGLKAQMGATEPPLAFSDFTYLLKALEGKEGMRPTGILAAGAAGIGGVSPAGFVNPLLVQQMLQQPSPMGTALTALASPDMRFSGPLSGQAAAFLSPTTMTYRLLGQQPAFGGYTQMYNN